jgi:dipeptidyl aminopeptidase/acylaminoacyl peptidase
MSTLIGLLMGVILVVFGSIVNAQNGRILEQQTVTLDKSLIQELNSKAPDSLAILDQIETTEITYISDGLKVKGFVLAPKKSGKYPVLIFNRGGCKNYGAMTKYVVFSWLAIYANWGYVVVASQYRGNAGSEGRDEFGGGDINDVLNLIPLIESLPNTDPSRIGMYGWSRGGLMTYLALTKTDRIRAAVVGGALTDLASLSGLRKRLRPDDDFEDFCLRDTIPDYDRNKQKELKTRSPIKWPEKLNKKTPILIFHGTADWRSSPQYSLEMAIALLKLKHPFRLVMLEGGDHNATEHLEEVDRITRDWLDRYVRDRKTWPSLEPHGN